MIKKTSKFMEANPSTFSRANKTWWAVTDLEKKTSILSHILQNFHVKHQKALNRQQPVAMSSNMIRSNVTSSWWKAELCSCSVSFCKSIFYILKLCTIFSFCTVKYWTSIENRKKRPRYKFEHNGIQEKRFPFMHGFMSTWWLG